MTSRINGLCEVTLMGHLCSEPIPGKRGTSLAFQVKTVERWSGVMHAEYHHCVLFNPKICEFMSAVPINTLLHIKGNLRHNSHNKRTEVFVRELRRLST